MSSPEFEGLDFSDDQKIRMEKIEEEKARLRQKLDRITRRIEKLQRRKEIRSSGKTPLKMPNWEHLDTATFPATKGAINLLLQYPSLNEWVKQLVDETVGNFLKNKDAQEVLKQMRVIRDKLMSSSTTICGRRRAVFQNSREYQWAKIANRRAVAVRFSTAIRRMGEIRENSSNTRLQRALDSLVNLRNMERTF